jgi:hypothetical protein
MPQEQTFEDAPTVPGHVASTAGLGVADAWLYVCKQPGRVMTYASVDANDTYHWPVDQWASIERRPLFAVSGLVAQRLWIDGSDESNLGWWDYDEVDLSTPLRDDYEALYSVTPNAELKGGPA